MSTTLFVNFSQCFKPKLLLWDNFRPDCSIESTMERSLRRYWSLTRIASRVFFTLVLAAAHIAWCNKVNEKVHATNEIPFERLKKRGLSPLKREYIIDKINLRRVQKDCLISYAGNQYSVPQVCVGRMWQSWPSTTCWPHTAGEADRSASDIVSRKGYGRQSPTLPQAHPQAVHGCRKPSFETGQHH